MMNRHVSLLLICSLLLGFASCKTALVDKTEYETGWEFDNPNQKQPKRNKGDKNQQKPDNKTAQNSTQKPVTKPSNSGISNPSLKKEVDQWLGTPYKYGGTTKAGVDCSGFCGNVYKAVYNITLGRSAQDIYDQSKPVSKTAMKESDFVFFKINSSRVSHVGIYLSDNKFVHASTSRGVIISDLTETYWTKYYFASGRVR